MGIQEAHSRAPGINEVGVFLRLAPPVDSQAARDVELWINKAMPWDPKDPSTKLDRSHLQVIGVGPKFFCVSIRSHVLRIDVVVGHAPHAWDAEDIEAEDKAKPFWKTLDGVLSRRPPPWAPLFLLLDTNIEVPPVGNANVGTHADICVPTPPHMRTDLTSSPCRVSFFETAFVWRLCRSPLAGHRRTHT